MSECLCTKSEFELFAPRAHQIAAIGSTVEEILSVSSVQNASVIEFRIVGGETFVDLNDIDLEIKARITMGDGTNLAANANIAQNQLCAGDNV